MMAETRGYLARMTPMLAMMATAMRIENMTVKNVGITMSLIVLVRFSYLFLAVWMGCARKKWGTFGTHDRVYGSPQRSPMGEIASAWHHCNE
jgi:hypothetical protein